MASASFYIPPVHTLRSNIAEGIAAIAKKLLPQRDLSVRRLYQNIARYMYIPLGVHRTHEPGEAVFRFDGRMYMVSPDGSLRRTV